VDDSSLVPTKVILLTFKMKNHSMWNKDFFRAYIIIPETIIWHVQLSSLENEINFSDFFLIDTFVPFTLYILILNLNCSSYLNCVTKKILVISFFYLYSICLCIMSIIYTLYPSNIYIFKFQINEYSKSYSYTREHQDDREDMVKFY